MTEQVTKLGWWASKSKGAKAGIIIFGTLVASAITFGIIHYSKKSDPANPNKPNPPSDSSKEETSIGEKTISIKDSKPHVETNALTLPNKGVGCSEVITTFDRDYDYVKCAGIWYTKSKQNPSSTDAKDRFKDWTSLEKNEVATRRLATRYPNF